MGGRWQPAIRWRRALGQRNWRTRMTWGQNGRQNGENRMNIGWTLDDSLKQWMVSKNDQWMGLNLNNIRLEFFFKVWKSSEP